MILCLVPVEGTSLLQRVAASGATVVVDRTASAAPVPDGEIGRAHV